MKKILLMAIVSIIICKTIAQNCTSVKELYKNKHEIGLMTTTHPYTIFDRHNGLSFEQTILNIRERIKNEKPNLIDRPIYDAYRTIFLNANSPMPIIDNGLPPNTISGLALWAKNSAFVYLIGLDSGGNYLDTNGYQAKRNEFKQNVLYAFSQLTGKINTNLIIEQYHLGDLQNQTRSLTLWLEAYDLLKATSELPELKNANRDFGRENSDRNGVFCISGNEITPKFIWL